jgi:hypothetical protein
MYDAHTIENISLYLYMHQTCFKHTTSMWKKHKPINNNFCVNFEQMDEVGELVMKSYCLIISCGLGEH